MFQARLRLASPSAMGRFCCWHVCQVLSCLRTGLDHEDPAYLEVALAVADLHVQADDAAAAHAVMEAVHATLEQVG